MNLSAPYTNIPIKNIYYMLCYAWNRLEEKNTVEISREDEKNIHNLLTQVLTNRLEKLIKRGYYKEYVSKEENKSTITGKINFQASLNELTFKQAKMYCEVDELSHDNLHNQIIKTTLYQLQKHSLISNDNKNEIKKINPYFQEIQNVRLTKRIFQQVKIHRTNQHYGFLIDICKFLFESLLMKKEENTTEELPDFIQEKKAMAGLYEEFVRNFYKKELKNSKIGSEELYWDAIGTEDDKGFLPIMETDLTMKINGKIIVLDTKFYEKILDGGRFEDKIRSHHLYQMFAYLNHTKNKYPEKPTGILLYPKVDKDLNLSYEILGYPIKVCTVDLNQPWQYIHKRLLKVVGVDSEKLV